MYGVRPLFIGMESKSLGQFQYFLGSEMKMFIDLQKDENSMFITQVKPGSMYTFDIGTMYKIKDMKSRIVNMSIDAVCTKHPLLWK